jgi:hypothetical protein
LRKKKCKKIKMQENKKTVHKGEVPNIEIPFQNDYDE